MMRQDPSFETREEEWPTTWVGEDKMEFIIRCASGKVPPRSSWLMRRYDDDIIITFKDLDDLAQYVKRYGNIVISECWWESDIDMVLTIYDDYME